MKKNADSIFPYVDKLRESIPVGSSACRPRCLCMGDSVVYGCGVDTADSFPNQLAHYLGSGQSARRLDIVNAGVCGYSALDSVLAFTYFFKKMSPDIIVWLLCDNDAELNDIPYDSKKYVLHLNEIWDEANGHIKYLKYAFDLLQQSVSVPVVVGVFGYPENAIHRRVERILSGLAEDHGFHFVDTLSVVDGLSVENRRVGAEDGHPSALMHRLFAKRVSNYIKAKDLLVGDSSGAPMIPLNLPETVNHEIDDWCRTAGRHYIFDVELHHDIIRLSKGLLVRDDERLKASYFHYLENRLKKGFMLLADGVEDKAQVRAVHQILKDTTGLSETVLHDALPRLRGLQEGLDALIQGNPGLEPVFFPLIDLAGTVLQLVKPLLAYPVKKQNDDVLRSLAESIVVRTDALLNQLGLATLLMRINAGLDSGEPFKLAIQSESETNHFVRIYFKVIEPVLKMVTHTYFLPYGKAEKRFTLPPFCKAALKVTVEGGCRPIQQVTIEIAGETSFHWNAEQISQQFVFEVPEINRRYN